MKILSNKNKGIVLLVLLFLSFFSATAFAKKKHKHRVLHRNMSQLVIGNLTGVSNLTYVINRLIANTDPNLNVSVYVKSMKYRDNLYTRNENRLLVPASVLKVLTAESALIFLGPEYHFETSFVTDAKNFNNGVLTGNLYLVHSGDPTLTYYDLADLVTVLKTQQIHTINGNVYVDNTAYDTHHYGPGWVWDDKRYCYAAPISASIINHNCLTFRITPGRSSGHMANIIESPGFFYSSIQNGVVTKSPGTRRCAIRLGTGTDNSLVISGCLPKGHYAQSVSTVINDIDRYNQSLLYSLFRHYGIRINGNIRSGAAPDNLPIIAVHKSKPLHLLINDMLKMSDNIIAGSLFKKLGEVYTKQPGSWENGSRAVTQILSRQIGVDVGRMNVIDGSGLSRYNQITTAQMMRVLDFAYHHYETNYEFISSLPVAGVDGTLKHRLRNVAWKVRAKTGTMTGVVALAGYVINRDREPLAFVIIVNGRNGMGWKYRSLEDQIVTALTHYSRTLG